MKNFIKKIVLLTFIAVGLLSCSEDSKDPVAKQSENFTLSNPTTGSFVLLPTNAGQEAFVASWTSADYNYQAAVNYRLQLVKASASFTGTNIPSLDLGNFSSIAGASFEKSVLVRDFNNLVLAANGGIGVSESYKIRIIGVVIGQLNTSDNNLQNN